MYVNLLIALAFGLAYVQLTTYAAIWVPVPFADRTLGIEGGIYWAQAAWQIFLTALLAAFGDPKPEVCSLHSNFLSRCPGMEFAVFACALCVLLLALPIKHVAMCHGKNMSHEWHTQIQASARSAARHHVIAKLDHAGCNRIVLVCADPDSSACGVARHHGQHLRPRRQAHPADAP